MEHTGVHTKERLTKMWYSKLIQSRSVDFHNRIPVAKSSLDDSCLTNLSFQTLEVMKSHPWTSNQKDSYHEKHMLCQYLIALQLPELAWPQLTWGPCSSSLLYWAWLQRVVSDPSTERALQLVTECTKHLAPSESDPKYRHVPCSWPCPLQVAALPIIQFQISNMTG